MKKVLLLLMVTCGIYQVRAQQSLQHKPADSLSKMPDLYFNPKSFNQFQMYQPKLNFNEALTKANISNVDHMPLVVLNGNSKMPVVKLGGYYTMPVKKIGTEEVIPVNESALFGLPTFKTP